MNRYFSPKCAVGLLLHVCLLHVGWRIGSPIYDINLYVSYMQEVYMHGQQNYGFPKIMLWFFLQSPERNILSVMIIFIIDIVNSAKTICRRIIGLQDFDWVYI